MDRKRHILSIDVGVKNLAICLLAGDATCRDMPSNGIEVLFWKWYDVTSGNANSAEKPTKRAAADKTNGGPTAPCVNIIRKSGKLCGKTGPVNARGRAYCGIHDPVRKHKPEDTQGWCYDMLRALPAIGQDLDACLDFLRGDVLIVIEQQSMDNKKIMMQSHLIYGHFVARYENKVPVRFVPAYNKLLVYDGPPVECTLKTKYAVRKFLGRKHTHHFLTTIPTLHQWKGFFDGCKAKQDDVADAFLQGLYVLIGKPSSKGAAPDDTENRRTPPRRRRCRKVRF